jgi:hypothetical protein
MFHLGERFRGHRQLIHLNADVRVLYLSTQDITKLDQVSFIFRYTIVDYKKLKLAIKESFLGFYPLYKHNAGRHVNLIKTILIHIT